MGEGKERRAANKFAATTLISATVEAVDPTGSKITVQSPRCEEKISVPVASPEVIKRTMNVGDHVRLELDMEGRIVNICKVPVVLPGGARVRRLDNDARQEHG
jgi:hypothetical protein